MTSEVALWEARIVELETRLAFQDQTLEELNGVIISQQHQLAHLDSALALIKKQLRQVAGGAEQADDNHGY